jgi:hypothetical protein
VILPSKIIDDMSAMMNRLLRAKKERSSPTGSTTVEPPLLPPYGNQMFAAASMFSPPGYMNCLDEKLLPSFDGHEMFYASFKENFQKLTSMQDESYLQMLLASERVMKNKDLRLQQISTHTAQ